MNRRAFLLGCTTVAVAAITPSPHMVTTDIRIRWQSWPFNTARPEEWGVGSGSLNYFLTRLKPIWPDAVWEQVG